MLKKLLSGLFGGGESNRSRNASEPVEYKGYLIVSEPADKGGQYRVSGWIRLPVEGGEVREHRFERSDMLPSREACDELMHRKARRYIDEMGEAMFSSS